MKKWGGRAGGGGGQGTERVDKTGKFQQHRRGVSQHTAWPTGTWVPVGGCTHAMEASHLITNPGQQGRKERDMWMFQIKHIGSV